MYRYYREKFHVHHFWELKNEQVTLIAPLLYSMDGKQAIKTFWNAEDKNVMDQHPM